MNTHNIFKSVLFSTLLLIGNSCSERKEIDVIPMPRSVEYHSGNFTISPETKFYTNLSAESRQALTDYLEGTSLSSVPFAESATGNNGIELNLCDSSIVTGNEAYRIEIVKKGVRLSANTETGIFYGLQTLLQLLNNGDNKTLPALMINDSPRFPYRGLHLDVSRHFFDKEFVKKQLNAMAYFKMNRLHWHLTDGAGWRIEIKKYPKLTETGAWRNSKVLAYGDVKPDGERYGGFYTQKDIKEIVAYAKKKFIEIIPEIDIPGHSQAAVAAYPEFLACDPENKHEVWLQQGISTDVINVANPKAMQFAKEVIDELTELFPFNYIHLGGYECPTNKWQKNDECKKLLSEIGSSNFRDLQIYFYKQLKDYIATKPADQQRQLIFWNEVLHGNTSILGNDITIMAWIGANAAAKQAAKQGMNTILSPQIPYYINRKQSKLPTEPMSQGHGTETVEAVYNYQPLKDVDAALQPYYKGVQANFWTEWVTEPSVLEYLMLPRLAAVAEAGWTPQEKRNYEDFKERIRKDAELYDLKGWNYGKHIMK